MVESESDPYEVILKKMREYPNDVPVDDEGNVSEAFKQYIKLFYTPEEAEIAQHLEIMPLSVKTIAERIGKPRKETKQILEQMAEKGIIQDTAGYSYFLTVAHLFNIGFKYSKALERLGKKGAELYQKFFIEEKFYKRYESSDKGTPLTRIVPIEKAIDHQSVITNAEEIHRILDNCSPPIVATDCPCRKRTETLGIRECKNKYPIEESCLQVGPFGRYFLDRGEGRELTLDEAHALVDDHAKLGLIFTTENVLQTNHQIICCCCECCCSLLRGMTRFEEKNEYCTAKSNYISQVEMNLCKGCGLCVERCLFNAISLEDKKATINPKKCYGCGACAVTCPTGAIKLYREERTEILENFKELTDRIHQENRS
ncbi:MAG: 4Fe-4S dicluster domain-containing protein [Candidatus Lokiarchaeota archaeon]|nr:4Fe-4S dicluster domain-containing protein [Candidatus Lokiarchaeota archaeon]MBD3338827.1 4Fe-4S dicluster domain-containing protein [Candidatus Lokiarchaeota archaeon]